MDYRQVQLLEEDERSVLICWLPVDRRVRKGVKLTLKEMPSRLWTVRWVGKEIRTETDLHKRWDIGNNGDI